MSSRSQKVRVGISIGDFNGIGPEIIMKSLIDKSVTDFFTPVTFWLLELIFNYLWKNIRISQI